MNINIFHHFEIISLSSWGGITNLVTGQWKCLLLFLMFSLGVKFLKPLRYFFYWIIDIVENGGKEVLGAYYDDHRHFCLTVFLMILFSNLYGLIPRQFSFNAHLIVTMTWALMIFSYGIFQGLKKPIKFINNFLPHGAPKAFILLITPIKIISFILSPISLGLRLFVNVLIGHVMMTIFQAFGQGPLISQIPSWLVLIGLTAMEMGVSLIQTYIFFIGSVNLLKNCIK
jgi:ATP synthase subunit 6